MACHCVGGKEIVCERLRRGGAFRFWRKIMEIREITGEREKSTLCEAILRALPGWFGMEESLLEYVEKVKRLTFWAAFDGERAVGFLALEEHNPYTGEVCVMGVLPEYHRRGAGRRLVEQCEAFAREKGMEFLTVKTLDASREDAGYARTREFYYAMGFRPLEVFPLLWDEANPCLFLAKYLGIAENN